MRTTNIFSIKNERGMNDLRLFLENKTSCAIFVGSGLNDIFHCCPHLPIFSRSLLRLAVVPSNSDVSPTNGLAGQGSPERRSFM